MIRGQVRKDTRRKPDAAGAVEDQGDGGRLHDHMGAARVGHGAQQFLELIGFRGSAVGRKHLLPEHILIGPDEPHLGVQSPLQRGFEKVGRCGLAIGPRHSHTGKRLRRVPEPVRRDQRQGRPGVLRHQPGSVKVRRAAAEHRHRPFFQRLPDIELSVGFIALQRRKQAARGHGPGVVADSCDFHVLVRAAAGERHTAEHLVQLHDSPPMVGWSMLSGSSRYFHWRRNPGPPYP